MKKTTFTIEKALKAYGKQSLNMLNYVHVYNNIARISNLEVDYKTTIQNKLENGIYKLIGQDLHLVNSLYIDDFPEDIDLDIFNDRGGIKFKVDLDIIKNLVLNCSKDYLRPTLQGIHYKTIDKKLYMVATDGHTLITKFIDKLDTVEIESALSGIIPASMLKILIKTGVKTLQGEIFKNGVTFSDLDNSFVLKSKNLNENYPDFEHAIKCQVDPVREIILNKSDLLDSIKELLPFSKNNYNKIITFEILDNYIQIWVGGEATKSVIIKGNFKDLDNISSLNDLEIDLYNTNLLMTVRTNSMNVDVEIKDFDYNKADTRQSFSVNIDLLSKILKGIKTDQVRIIQNSPLKGLFFEDHEIK